MARWFRHYAGMMRDEKLVRAALKSKQPIERVVWVWGVILESAAELDQNGRYEIDPAEIAYFLRADEADINGIIDALEALGRVDHGSVAKWGERQYQSDRSAERQARYRDKKRRESDDGNDKPETSRDAVVTSLSRHGDAPEAEAEAEAEKESSSGRDAPMLLLDRLNEILGIDPAKQINPNWHKTQIQLCRDWIALGRQPDQITAIVSAVAERQRGADPTWRASTLKYFDDAVHRGDKPKPPDPLKGWRPAGECTDQELGWYRDAAVIAAARQIPDKLWREPRGRDWTLRLESFSKSKSKRWPDAWGDPPWEVGDNPLAADLLLHFPDVRPA